jgi:two-component system, NarL family, nitrate/nitrite response regulator NarL
MSRSMVDRIQVLVVADNLLTRAGLAALLETHADCVVAGQTTSDNLLDTLELTQPDMVLYDMGWRVADALDGLATIEKQDVGVLALLADENDASNALAALSTFAAYGLLLNESDPDLLHMALQAIHAGLIVIDPALADILVGATNLQQETLPEPLTPRENDVLQLLAQGLTNKAIAHQLGITDHTVKFHVNAIMTKMGAQSRTEAVVMATRAGLIIL